MGYDSEPAVYPGLEPRKFPGTTSERKCMSMSMFLRGDVMSTHNNSLRNLLRGVGERVLYTDRKCTLPVQPVKGIFEARCGVYRDRIAKLSGHQSPISRQSFVDLYSGRRRSVYQRAVDSLGFHPVRPSDAHLKTFVKSEKLNLSRKPDPVPRVIQPRDPRYNVEVGKYLKNYEHKLYEAIDTLFEAPTVFSSYNAFTSARLIKDKWDSFSHPVCVGVDASRFDQHVSVPALEFEHGLYSRVFKSRELNRLLSWQIDNVGLARASDGKFKYKKKGGRASGDMNTSMGNKFIMCLMCKSYIDSKTFRIEFVNNGDDCLLILDRRHLRELSDVSAWFNDFGFKLTLEEPVDVFERIEFCQTRPVCCNNVWRMVRDVKLALQKDVFVVNLGHREDEYRRRLLDVANCGLAISEDVPVLGSFYHMLKRFGEAGKYSQSDINEYSFYYAGAKGAKCNFTTTDDYGRFSFYLSTGITPDSQVELETYFNDSVWGADNRQVITTLVTQLLE